jgi:hypothetical protein
MLSLAGRPKNAAHRGHGGSTLRPFYLGAAFEVQLLQVLLATPEQHTNQQLSQLLILPDMRSEGPALTDEQRQALLALRQLAVTFIEHADHATAGLMYQ